MPTIAASESELHKRQRTAINFIGVYEGNYEEERWIEHFPIRCLYVVSSSVHYLKVEKQWGRWKRYYEGKRGESRTNGMF